MGSWGVYKRFENIKNSRADESSGMRVYEIRRANARAKKEPARLVLALHFISTLFSGF